MSWDVALVKIRGDFRPISEVEDDDYLPLGDPPSVRAAIRSTVPSAKWSGEDSAVLEGDDFTIEFDLHSLESANTVVLNIRGTGDPIPSVLKLTESNGWIAVDCSTGEFIDPNDPSYEGWEGFKSL